jgi:hypothetical protein
VTLLPARLSRRDSGGVLDKLDEPLTPRESMSSVSTASSGTVGPGELGTLAPGVVPPRTLKLAPERERLWAVLGAAMPAILAEELDLDRGLETVRVG